MLKLPGVGTALNSFMNVSVIGHGMLELAIIYKTTNAYGVTIHKMQNYEIYSDDRHPNIQNEYKSDHRFVAVTGIKHQRCNQNYNR